MNELTWEQFRHLVELQTHVPGCKESWRGSYMDDIMFVKSFAEAVNFIAARSCWQMSYDNPYSLGGRYWRYIQQLYKEAQCQN